MTQALHTIDFTVGFGWTELGAQRKNEAKERKREMEMKKKLEMLRLRNDKKREWESCWFESVILDVLLYLSQSFIIKVFRTLVFIFIVISTTFRPICPPAFFRCLSNSGTFTELWTMSFIETTGVAYSDSVCHIRVQVLSIPVYYSPVVRIEPATFRWLSS